MLESVLEVDNHLIMSSHEDLNVLRKKENVSKPESLQDKTIEAP